MASVMKPFRGREGDDSNFKSNNLWVGSLTTDTTESDLTELFGRYGDIDRITAYSSRSFAFIYYRHVEEAVAAKEALQGANLNGSQIKIEYARPAKPCKSLWVGGIGPSVTKDDLEEEFSKFGKIEDFRFLRERKTAFIDYCEMDDALQAKSMNGKRMGGSYLRVDFLRSQAPKKEQWAGSYDNRNGNIHHKSQYPHSYEDGKGDGQPRSKVLWVGYPPTVQIEKHMLHNAMILFGEIEIIKMYPSRHFSLVVFRSVEEACKAKEGLQGRLFNDSRITIMYSNDELPPEEDDTSFYSGVKRSRPDMFINDPSFVSSPHSTGNPGSMRPFRGSSDRSYNASEYNDAIGKESNWRRPSPNGTGILPSPAGPGILPSPAQGMRHPTRSNPGSWEGYDSAQLDRESKRTRRDGSVDGFTPMGADERSFGRGSVAARPIRVHPDSDYMWRGMIAKGGTPVCCARCVPIGKGIETKLPEVVNCSARTGLDMLAKHYTEAIGFEIVFFLPDSEEDFASYTEFLLYLGSKNRAGVAKLDDGTTLFLVPPSDFLTDVLKVSFPERRLYGVVLKLPPPAVPVAASYRQESLSNTLPYMDQSRDSPANASHSLYPPRENYNRSAPEQLTAPSKPSVSEPLRTANSAVPQAGVSLTPELLATLASFLPATSQPAASNGNQPMSGTSTVVSTVTQSNGLYNGGAPSQDWKRDPQTVHDASNQSFQQYGNHYTPAGHLPPPPPRYPPASNNPNYSNGMVHGNMQYQGQSVTMPQLSPLPNMPHNNYAMYSQGSSHHSVSQPMTQQYQPEASVPNQNYGPIPSYQQANYHGLTTNQAHNINPSQFQAAMQPPADKANLEPQSQAPQLQPMLSGAGQGTTDGEVDKNQRYQSTLQFAANLLLQIQQKQQQQQQSSGTPAGHGP